MDIEQARMAGEVIGFVALLVGGRRIRLYMEVIKAVVEGVEYFSKYEAKHTEDLKKNIYMSSRTRGVERILDTVVDELGYKNGKGT